MTNLLYTPIEPAEVLGLSRTRVYWLLAVRETESVQIGVVHRIRADALDRYVRRLLGAEWSAAR
jgi:excisionase family DNA binding protein